jgi:putative heme-binding domain-containing protein
MCQPSSTGLFLLTWSLGWLVTGAASPSLGIEFRASDPRVVDIGVVDNGVVDIGVVEVGANVPRPALPAPTWPGQDRYALRLAPPADLDRGLRLVLLAGDEEYRSEEALPMLAKILSRRHGFHCTVLFSLSADGQYIDANHQAGVGGLETLAEADLLLISTRFRRPSAQQAEFLNQYLLQGKPVIGLRTATHAFTGTGSFGDWLPYDDFGIKILGERWVNHHGEHKVQGARSVVVPEFREHPLLRGVGDFFAPSDVYGVIHLTEQDQVLLRGAVTETLDPSSPNVVGRQNDPLQALAWLHRYETPSGKGGQSFCTTAGAAVDFVDPNLRRLVVNAVYYLLGQEVPAAANVDHVDPFDPSFYGFINDPNYWPQRRLQPADLGWGRPIRRDDPPGSPAWPFRDADRQGDPAGTGQVEIERRQRVALVGGSLAERMNLFGHFETLLQTRFPDREILFRNFGWPADEVALQQRPANYTAIDDPLEVFAPDLFICFFGFNESFRGLNALDSFRDEYRRYLANLTQRFTREGRVPKFVLVSPLAFEPTGNPLQPSGEIENQHLAAYAGVVRDLAAELNLPLVDLFAATEASFSHRAARYTINGVHLNEQGDRMVAEILDQAMFGSDHPRRLPTGEFDWSQLEPIRQWVNEKSWVHLQDYRMLNGWYVYGGRRTWDTETFPAEYRKIRQMVAVRDQYLWDLVSGQPVSAQPDDSQTGDVVVPQTMFGTRDENFRRGREPEELVYPTPEQAIEMMSVPEGFRVELFASEREFPELANPTQMAFDSRGRLWVSCMVTYPQWQPGMARPTDRLLIFEDTDSDGKADRCIPFYDKLSCPTGFEFWNGGVLVVDQPRILFLKDTDGDDRADVVEHWIDGVSTDDTHHSMGAWEISHGGFIYMQEGIATSTTMETPWGPFRNKDTGGSYIFDPHRWKFRHFITPGYGNPWCMVFDRWGNGIIGDGTGAQQHWASPLSGLEVPSRKTLRPIFDNQGMRPAIGSEFLFSRHFPDDVQGQFIYACVINMHGLPRFTVEDEATGSGLQGRRIEDLLNSTDMIFRPVDPLIGPDGALWFGDWCNALIGHMQYSQRDPNRDQEHGRIYRLVYEPKPLLPLVTLHDKSIPELLDHLLVYELRTRYRVRTELRARPAEEVLSAVDRWIAGSHEAEKLCEAMWLKESFRVVDLPLLDKILEVPEYRARAAAIHTLSNLQELEPQALPILVAATRDPHPRVRLEAVRGLSFFPTAESLHAMLSIVDQDVDYWLDYTLEHSLQALQSVWGPAERQPNFLADVSDQAREYFRAFRVASGPGGAAVEPLAMADNVDLPLEKRMQAIESLAKLEGGNSGRGKAVYQSVCSACHQVGEIGKAFGPNLSDIGARMNKVDLIKSILLPNEDITKGYETILVLTDEGETYSGFILEETDQRLRLGISDGKILELSKEQIEQRKDMKASSMPEGLMKSVAASEFLDLVAFLAEQTGVQQIRHDGWVWAQYATPLPLRTDGDLIEVSRHGKLKLGGDFPPHWNVESHLLLSPIRPKQFDFAFHSAEQVESPHVMIDLQEETTIYKLVIDNRQNRQFVGRAEGLSVSVSSDGVQWHPALVATEARLQWSREFPSGLRARYLKLGLERSGTLHLYGVTAYGKSAPDRQP